MRLLIYILSVLLAAACSESDNSTPDAEGIMIAVIDGTQWEANSQQNVIHVLSNFQLSGKNVGDQSTITILLTGVNGPGTYEIKDGNSATFLSESENTVFGTNDDNTGTLTITSLTATRAKGTFSFDAENVLGGTAGTTISVRNGEFDVPVSN